MDIYCALKTSTEKTSTRGHDHATCSPVMNGSCRGNSSPFLKLFWGTQQRIMKQLLVSQKVDRAVEIAKDAVERGNQAVISLWGTGEARTADKIRDMQKKTARKQRRKGSHKIKVMTD